MTFYRDPVGFVWARLGLVLGIAMVQVPLLDRIALSLRGRLPDRPEGGDRAADDRVVRLRHHVEDLHRRHHLPVSGLINTIAGLRSVIRPIRSITAMCVTRAAAVALRAIPNALPYIFAGLNIAASCLSVIGAIVGEFVGAKAGIGVLILQANFGLDLASMFAVLVLMRSPA